MLKERVNGEGILQVHLPLGQAEAGREVRVVVEPIGAQPPMIPEEWRAGILATAGTWVGDFERPDQGVLEERDPR